jgi:hypothetical protein
VGPYRIKAERSKEVTLMTKEELEAHMVRYLTIGTVLLVAMGLGTCAFVSHDEHHANVEVQDGRVRAERAAVARAAAERDRAMFDSLNRGK